MKFGDLVEYLLWSLYVREQAHPAARQGRASRQRDHRHAHPEGVERGGVAVVGERIQA